MQSLGYELLDLISRQSSVQKDVSISSPWNALRSGSDCRDRCTDVMRYFVNKFPDGYEGWAKERGEDPVSKDYLKPY